MNTIEKRKLEAILASKLNSARAAYAARREAEQTALIAKLEENAPKEVQQLAVKLVQLEATHDKQKSKLEESAAALGFQIDTDYDGRERIRLNYDYGDGGKVYSAPELRQHAELTRTTLRGFDNLLDRYVISIYAETEDMSNLLNAYSNDLNKLTA
jgi:hypothetical protein